MNNPARIHFFTTPRNQLDYERVYTPPKHESDIIAKFIEMGYAPVVDGLLPCPPLQNVRGIYWNIEDEEIFFTQGSANEIINPFLLIYWYQPLSANELEVARQYFADVLGLPSFKRKIVTRHMSRMLEGNFFKPPPPQPLLSASVGRKDYVETLADGRIVVNRVQGGIYTDDVNRLLGLAQAALDRLENTACTVSS